MPEIQDMLPNGELRFRDLIRLALRTFRVKPVRAMLTVAGMSVGIGTVLFLVSLGYGLQYILIGKLVTTEESLVTMQIAYPSETSKIIDALELEELRRLPEVVAVSPVYEFPGEVGLTATSTLLVDTREIEENYFRLSGIYPNIGKEITPETTDGVVITSQTLTALGVPSDESALNKNLILKVFYQEPTSVITDEAIAVRPLHIEGIITDDSMPPMVIVDTGALSKPPPFTYSALVQAKDINQVEPVRDALIERGFVVSARIDLVTQAQKIMNAITIVLGAFGITALIVSAIGMFNTMIVGFMERTYEVGILKSLGATDADVRNLFLIESIIMGLCGGAGGILLGYGGGQVLNMAISALAVSLGGEAFELFLTPVWFILLIIGLSIAIGFISGFWPAHRASQLSPKEAFVKR